MAFRREDIERVRNATNIVELLEGVTTVKKRGRTFTAICPFHQEKTPSLSIDVGQGLYHCLAGDTGVMTWDGVVPIAKLAGESPRLLTTGGVWVDAPIKSFGEQSLWEIRLSRNRVPKILYATSGHRWLVRAGRRMNEVLTQDLQPGMPLAYAYPNTGSADRTEPAPFGVAQGLVFGDGTRTEYGSVAQFAREEDRDMLRFFPEANQWATTPGVIKIGRLPVSFKDLPPLSEARGHLYGWLAGYFAADGCVSRDGQVTMASAKLEHVEFVRTLANRLGMGTYGIKRQDRKRFGESLSPLYSVTFINSTLDPAFFVLAEHRERFEKYAMARTGPERKGWVVREVRQTDRVEEVFCAQVVGTHAFTLEDNILTGNCFGCQAGGDVFKFVQDTQGLDFSESVEYLAARAGIPLQRDPEAIRRKGEREALIEATRKAVDFYRDRLKKAHDAGPARSYLRSRGYDVDVIDRFQLGYSPGGELWDGLVTHLRDAGVSDKVMIGAGLAARTSRGRLRDWFRGRVMFPIFDLRGDPVGFGARILEGEGPKYLNSPETRIYQKARLLYGLNWAKSDIARSGYSLVVEGYTDVIGLQLADLPLAVATCGTALGEDHFDLLRRFAERVVLAFDADQAGAGAAIRGDELETPVKLNLDLRVAVMPEGRDPADLVQAGEVAAMQKAINESTPLLQFRLERELERFDLSEPEERARAVRSAARLIARQPDDLVRREYGRFVARRVGVEFEVVMREIRGGSAGKRPEPDTRDASPRRPSGIERAERELLRAILANDPRLADTEVEESLFAGDLYRDGYLLLAPAVADLPPGEPPDLASLIGEGESGVPALLRSLALESLPLSDPVALVDRLRAWRIERDIADLRHRLDRINPADDAETYSTLFEQLIALERKKRELGDR